MTLTVDSLGSLRAALERVAATPDLATLHPGLLVADRFEIIALAGRGGMGVVWQARDQRLDRVVAIKVSAWAAVGGADEVLREAAAMAKLAHPNVIAVHEVLVEPDALLIVMEWVDGTTLRRWCETPRRWEAVLAAYLQAGEGLAAVHEAGLVHHDVKPDNILVAANGRIRLADFGLARAIAAAPDAGGTFGTPAYQAPEQATGAASDARSDQYAFCAALLEGVTGERAAPGAPRERSLGRAPARVRRALARGLAADPVHRYPAMPALLADLRAALRSRRRIAAVAAALAIAIAAAVVLLARPQAIDAGAACALAASRFGAAWDPVRRVEVIRAFAASERPWAKPALAATLAKLDGYRQQLDAAGRDACDGTYARRDQSPAVLDLRVACLTDRSADLRSTVALLGDATAAMTEIAPRAVETLPRVESCADVETLRGSPEPPTFETARAAATLRDLLAAVRAYQRLGQPRMAAALLAPAMPAAESLAYPPLLADALLLQGGLADDLGDRTQSEALLRRASVIAEAARRDDVKAQALSRLAFSLGNAGGRTEEANTLLELAAAAVVRSGNPPNLRATIASARAALAFNADRGA